MTSRVITVASSLGSGGEEIARVVASKLGFRYVDDEIIRRAAEKAGVSPETVAQAEHTPGMVTRILQSMGRNPVVSLEGPIVPPAYDPPLGLPGYESLIVEVVRETGAQGNVVIVAHGAGIHLAGLSGLVRVFITASPAVRAERLVREAGLDERGARKAIAGSERQRREYLRRFCGVGQELAAHYDLVINTDASPSPRAAELIATAAQR